MGNGSAYGRTHRSAAWSRNPGARACTAVRRSSLSAGVATTPWSRTAWTSTSAVTLRKRGLLRKNRVKAKLTSVSGGHSRAKEDTGKFFVSPELPLVSESFSSSIREVRLARGILGCGPFSPSRNLAPDRGGPSSGGSGLDVESDRNSRQMSISGKGLRITNWLRISRMPLMALTRFSARRRKYAEGTGPDRVTMPWRTLTMRFRGPISGS